MSTDCPLFHVLIDSAQFQQLSCVAFLERYGSKATDEQWLEHVQQAHPTIALRAYQVAQQLAARACASKPELCPLGCCSDALTDMPASLAQHHQGGAAAKSNFNPGLVGRPQAVDDGLDEFRVQWREGARQKQSERRWMRHLAHQVWGSCLPLHAQTCLTPTYHMNCYPSQRYRLVCTGVPPPKVCPCGDLTGSGRDLAWFSGV